MTTTEPIATWIDGVLPAHLRDEGKRLLAEVAAVRDQLAPLLDRIGQLLADHEIACREATAQIEAAEGADAARAIDDGLSVMLGLLDGATELHGALSDMGIDPDELLFKANRGTQ